MTELSLSTIDLLLLSLTISGAILSIKHMLTSKPSSHRYFNNDSLAPGYSCGMEAAEKHRAENKTMSFRP